jgi:hypothetical protein
MTPTQHKIEAAAEELLKDAHACSCESCKEIRASIKEKIANILTKHFASDEGVKDKFVQGLDAMTRHCLDAVGLVKSGKWNLDAMERWLRGCQDNGADFAREIIAEMQQLKATEQTPIVSTGESPQPERSAEDWAKQLEELLNHWIFVEVQSTEQNKETIVNFIQQIISTSELAGRIKQAREDAFVARTALGHSEDCGVAITGHGKNCSCDAIGSEIIADKLESLATSLEQQKKGIAE